MSTSSDRNLIVEVLNDKTQVVVRSINVQTLKVKTDTFACYFANKIQRENKFFQKLESILDLKKVKAIGFQNIDIAFDKLSDGLEYRFKCRDFCEENGIYMLFVNIFHTIALAALSESSTMVKEGENVMIVFHNYFFQKLCAMRINREKDRYRIKNSKMSDYPILSEQWKEDFMENFNPEKTILFLDATLKRDKKELASITNFFKPSATIEHSEELMAKSFVDTILHLMGEKINPYYVVYETNCKYNVLVGKEAYIHASGVVPCEFSNIAVVDPAVSISLFMDLIPYRPKELAKEVKLSTFKDVKMVAFILTLDINSFFELKVEAVPDDMLSRLNISPASLPKKFRFNEKARIVFGKQHFSVYFVGGSKLITETDSDGLEKTPLFIAFHEKKPVVGRKAKELLATKPQFVVYDLIKLASISSADIDNPKWGFRVSKEEDSVMLTMQTVEGEKSSSIEFLFAILLGDGIKRIFKTCNEKVEELQVQFDEITPNEILKKNIVKAGKFLNVNIVFA